nr:MAG TPA: Prodomain subtilisin 2 [Caudoviricetes sp.]
MRCFFVPFFYVFNCLILLKSFLVLQKEFFT